jgi:hypothetical protein
MEVATDEGIAACAEEGEVFSAIMLIYGNASMAASQFMYVIRKQRKWVVAW